MERCFGFKLYFFNNLNIENKYLRKKYNNETNHTYFPFASFSGMWEA